MVDSSPLLSPPPAEEEPASPPAPDENPPPLPPAYASLPSTTEGTSSSNIRISKILTILGLVVVLLGLLYLANDKWTVKMALSLVYFYATFEILSGCMFFLDIAKLHNGWAPTSGSMNQYLAESGGIVYFFWGLLLCLEAKNTTILYLNSIYCGVWVVYLGSIWMQYPRTLQDSDGSWAAVPVIVKTTCGVGSVVAAYQLQHQ
jgi:hypothetical protein